MLNAYKILTSIANNTPALPPTKMAFSITISILKLEPHRKVHFTNTILQILSSTYMKNIFFALKILTSLHLHFLQAQIKHFLSPSKNVAPLLFSQSHFCHTAQNYTQSVLVACMCCTSEGTLKMLLFYFSNTHTPRTWLEQLDLSARNLAQN